MKKIISIALIAVLALALLAGCGSSAAPATTTAPASEAPAELRGTVATDGSTSMEKVIGALGEAFMEQNKGVTFTYNPTGSGSGIPSVVYGLVGMLFFCRFLGMQTSLMAGALTLVIMNLPTIMRTTQESLKTVPQSYREGAFGLGAGKWRVIRTVVLPGCVDGVITGCILSVGRILGESAALLFTAGFAHALNGLFAGLAGAGATLTVALCVYAEEKGVKLSLTGEGTTIKVTFPK